MSAPTVATHVSSVNVSTIVDPPARMSVSLSSVTVPLSAAEPAATAIWNVGAATNAPADCVNAAAGIVAVIVSGAVMS